ncbi:hypothetical protein MHTCC0001_05680 [Flavobacteriaceae bacterium MHTCC 0001]
MIKDISFKVSIIMATFNREQFIMEAVQSIINQTYSNWECLIIDDGGTDNTEATLKKTIENDNRFKFLKRPHTYKKGLPGCRNYGLNIAQGGYIIFFDDDDIVHPLNLEICLSVFKEYPTSFFCNYLKQSFNGKFNYNLINKGYKFSIEKSADDLLESVVTHEKPFASCTVMWKKECFEGNKFNEDLMYAEEWECYQRILSEENKGVLIDKTLYFNRKHETSNTNQFWSNAPLRVNSKKKAIELVAFNLADKKLFTPKLLKYLVSLAIGFRDFKLVKKILKISKTNKKLKFLISLKYWLFPVRVFYKKMKK